MKIGAMELLVIFVVALIVLGPEKMPYYTKKLGKALGELKGYSNKLAEDIRENIVEPLEETTAPLKDAVEPLTTLKKDIEQPLKDVQTAMNSIGKTKPQEKEENKETVVSAEETPVIAQGEDEVSLTEENNKGE